MAPKKAAKKWKGASRRASSPSPNTNAGSAGSDSILIWGRHACEAAIRNPDRQIAAIATDRNPPTWLTDALNAAQEQGIARPEMQIVSRPELESLVPDQAVHQGVAMSVLPLVTPSLDELAELALAREQSIILVLDQVVDPHNVGAIVRTAAAYGALGLIVQSRHAPPINGTLYKTACGGCEYVPIIQVTNIARALGTLADAGISAVGFAEQGSVELRAYAAPKHCAIVMGAEGTGLRRLVAESCDALVSLSTPGKISTLNVSNATAIALHHIDGRQRFGNH